MQVSNPNNNKDFENVYKNAGGSPEWGVRHSDDGVKEWVHIPSGKSNHTYIQPDVVMDPTGCVHVFEVENIGKREVYCPMCGFATTFHAGINYFEENGESHIVIREKRYKLKK